MLGKAAEKVGRVATILHCIHAAHLGSEVSQKIPASRVRAAIKWVEYTTQQALSINIEVCSPDALESNLAKIISLAERNEGTVTARDVLRVFDAKNRPTSQAVREWFGDLEALNYGEVTEKGRSIRFSLHKTTAFTALTGNPDSASISNAVDKRGDTAFTAFSTQKYEIIEVNAVERGENAVKNRVLESAVDKDLNSNAVNAVVFTSSAETSQPSMLSCTTESEKSSTKTSATKTPTFKEGDRVAVKDVGGLYQGARGEILGKFYDRDNLVTYLVKFDKRVGNVQQHDFEPTELMKL
jgi:hypothetical protein